MTPEPVKKSTAVALRRGKTGVTEMLVFEHPLKEGGIMVQLPAGTIEPNEPPDEAAIRELREETGVNGELIDLAGVRDEVWEGQHRRRWVYMVRAPAGLPDEWPYKCDCGRPIRCYWLPFDQAQIMEPQQPWVEMARAWSEKTGPLFRS